MNASKNRVLVIGSLNGGYHDSKHAGKPHNFRNSLLGGDGWALDRGRTRHLPYTHGLESSFDFMSTMIFELVVASWLSLCSFADNWILDFCVLFEHSNKPWSELRDVSRMGCAFTPQLT